MEKKILKNVSGFANPGEVTIIMGASGAGKTSLLNVLSRQLVTTKNARISGEIKANGYDLTKLSVAKFTSYVTQEDHLFATLTPKECLEFSAEMRTGIKGDKL